MLLSTLAPGNSMPFKAYEAPLSFSLSPNCIVKMTILKKIYTQINKFKATFVPKLHIYNSITYLCKRLLPFRSLNYSVWFCLLFKIISTSAGETTNKNCFYESFAEVPWAAFFILTGLVQTLLSSLKEWQDAGSDVTEAGVRKDGVEGQASRARLGTSVQAC